MRYIDSAQSIFDEENSLDYESGYNNYYGINNRELVYEDENIFNDTFMIEEKNYNDIKDSVTGKPEKHLKVVCDINYDKVANASINLLESTKKGKKVDVLNTNPDVRKKKTQAEVDREIVEYFYADPTVERFNLIWDRFYYGVHSHACNIMGDWKRAEDMVQETFQRAWEKKNFYDPAKSNYSTWIYTICRNVCSTTIRKEHKDKCVDIDVSDMFDNMACCEKIDKAVNEPKYYTVDAHGKVEENNIDDIARKLFDASIAEIDSMDPLFAKIIKMKDIDDLTMREIAVRLEINESKVKNTYYKYRTILADKLKTKYKDLCDIYTDAKHDKEESEPDIPQYKNRMLDDVDEADIPVITSF